MRFPLMSVGVFTFEDEPVNKGLIGGKVIATNTETREVFSKTYKKFHTGKTNKFDVMAQLIYELEPPKSMEAENSGGTTEET